MQPPVSPESPCSIEPDSNTLLAFYTAQNPVQLALLQSDTDLRVERKVAPGPHGRRAENLYVDNAFRSLQPLFITVSLGAQGTAVYIDGILARAARRFRIPAGDCTGRLGPLASCLAPGSR